MLSDKCTWHKAALSPHKVQPALSSKQLNFHFIQYNSPLNRNKDKDAFVALCIFFSTIPHWHSQLSVCAGWCPAAVCESRPPQGQTEPLCYPLLPCVPPGFSPPFSFLCCFLKAHTFQNSSSSSSRLFYFFFFLLSSSEKTQQFEKRSHHLLLLGLLTMQIPSLSSSALPLASLPSLSLSLPPSLSATVGEVFLIFFFFSSPSLALPRTLIVF